MDEFSIHLGSSQHFLDPRPPSFSKKGRRCTMSVHEEVFKDRAHQNRSTELAWPWTTHQSAKAICPKCSGIPTLFTRNLRNYFASHMVLTSLAATLRCRRKSLKNLTASLYSGNDQSGSSPVLEIWDEVSKVEIFNRKCFKKATVSAKLLWKYKLTRKCFKKKWKVSYCNVFW